MAQYLPLHDEGTAFTRTASAAVTGGRLVEVSGNGTVAHASAASAKWLGVAANDAAAGDSVTIYRVGVQRPVASGAVNAGDALVCAANGVVATSTSATPLTLVGLALTNATDGATVEVALNR